jgi:hypothetical protein
VVLPLVAPPDPVPVPVPLPAVTEPAPLEVPGPWLEPLLALPAADPVFDGLLDAVEPELVLPDPEQAVIPSAASNVRRVTEPVVRRMAVLWSLGRVTIA